MQTAAEIYESSRRFGEAYAAVMRPLCERLGMAQPALDILLFLANNPGHDTAREICVCRGLKPAIVSFHVDNLVRGGYLERGPMPGDRRKCRLTCTALAEPVIREGRQMQERFYGRLLDGIGEESLETIRRCMETANQNLDALLREESARRASSGGRERRSSSDENRTGGRRK